MMLKERYFIFCPSGNERCRRLGWQDKDLVKPSGWIIFMKVHFERFSMTHFDRFTAKIVKDSSPCLSYQKNDNSFA